CIVCKLEQISKHQRDRKPCQLRDDASLCHIFCHLCFSSRFSFQFPVCQQLPQLFCDQTDHDCRRYSSFSHTLQMSCKYNGQDTCDHDKGHIESHFHISEFDREHPADCKNDAFSREH